MKRLVFILITIFNMANAQYKYPVKYVALEDSTRMAYVDVGEPTAKTLLFVHGLGGYVKHWYPVIDALSSEYRCIVVDLPGYGASDWSVKNRVQILDYYAQSIHRLATSLQLKSVTLIGHSMGGQVAIIAALKSPVWLSRLVLAAPAGFETFSQQEASMLQAFSTPQMIMNQTEEQIRTAYQMNFVAQPEWVEEMIVDRLVAREHANFSTYATVRSNGVVGMLSQPVAHELQKISFPTLVIFGVEDKLIPNKYLHPTLTTSDVAKIGETIPDVQIEMIESAGHMLQVDQPEKFNNHIKNFTNPLNPEK